MSCISHSFSAALVGTLVGMSGVFVSSPSFAGAGFEVGNQFEAFEAHAYISVTCSDFRGRTAYASYNCRAGGLKPSMRSRFVTDSGVVADHVALRANHADGSKRDKESRFDSSKGVSGERFNLWIRTVTQRPLLEVGTNRIQYKLSRDGATVERGEFLAEVHRGQIYTCPSGYYRSPDLNDCYSRDEMCDYHLRKHDYCQ